MKCVEAIFDNGLKPCIQCKRYIAKLDQDFRKLVCTRTFHYLVFTEKMPTLFGCENRYQKDNQPNYCQNTGKYKIYEKLNVSIHFNS